MFENFTFEDPQWFWLFLLLPLAIAWYVWKRNQQIPAVKMASLQGFKTQQSLLPKFRHVLFVFRILALALLITAMARPRTVDMTTQVKTTKGIDIVLSIDVSASMLAQDLEPNRLEAIKEVAAEFIKNRPNDRIGLVVYAGESYTKTPLTTDKSIVLNALQEIEYSNLLQGGTAIGMGLATAVNRLKNSTAKSKVIILLTDGVNNAGFIDPKIASELAAEFDIKVYTIGVGSNGMAVSPIALLPNGQFQYGRVQVEIDEQLMQQIADATGGKYFRATDNQKLEAIYGEINKLEKTEIEETKYYNYDEKFRSLVILAGIFLLLEILLRLTVFRSFV
ncbi:MAG TPA: VWA domain-containing protein [Flavobacteriaceae bacterium]|nr:VWA domain-containing protein [Flavobacteriaceae bacterium]